MPLARASELDRLFKCPGPVFLPREVDREGIAAAYGTCVHYWAETGEVLDSNHGRLLKRKLKATGVKREDLWPEDGEHEVSFAYNVLSFVVRRYVAPSPLPAGYSRREHVAAWKGAFNEEWIVGTLDYARPMFDSYWVDDLKTGRTAHWNDHQYQQQFYCLTFSLDTCGEVRDGRSTLTHWRRYPVDSLPERNGRAVEADLLKRFQDRCVGLHADYLDAKSRGDIRHKLNPGEHCKYCHSYTACPAPKPI